MAPPGEFDAFVAIHRQPALRYATRVLRRSHDAEEALQEALVRAWSAWDSVEDPSSREAWFFRVLRNCCIDVGRRPVNREIPSADVAVTDSPPLPEDQIVARDSLARVQLLLAAIPPDQRRTLLLREIADLSYNEIAKVTGAKRGTVMSRLFSARKRLAGLLVEADLR